MEVNALARTDDGEPDKGREGDHDAQHLEPRRALAEHQQRAQQGPDRAGGADGRGEGDRQVFHRKIAAHPRTRDQEGFRREEEVLVAGQRGDGQRRGERSGRERVQGHEREPDGGAAQIGEEENRKHGVVAHGVLGAKIVAPEEKSGDETGGDPRHGAGWCGGKCGGRQGSPMRP